MKNLFFVISLVALAAVVGGCNSNAQRKIKFRFTTYGTIQATDVTPSFGTTAGGINFSTANWNTAQETPEILVDKGDNVGWITNYVGPCREFKIETLQDGQVVSTKTLTMGTQDTFSTVPCQDGSFQQYNYIVD
jgi:hypothetical protein